jgi:ABC-2 type transport system permease protein
MFEQILVGPFTRAQYILSNVYTIGIIGLVSAAMITAVGYPLFFKQVEFNILTVPLVIFASITGSILFGSIASIISTRLKSSEGFNVIINTVFLFFAFVSTAFYPAQGAPSILSTAFYFNPLTYLVDVVRAGIFGYFNDLVATEMVVLGVGATILFLIATKLLSKLEL